MSKVNAYQVVTDRIIELMEQGTVPWRKPWTGGGEASNLISKRPYRGVNHFMLNISGYACPYWATFNQIKKKGGKVKKGEKSTPVVFWKWYEREDPKSGEITEKPVLRYYRVFNLEQTEGIELPKEDKPEEKPFSPIERCESLMAGIANPPQIQHKQQSAWYRPGKDLINLPKPESFESPEEYYSTLFHELAHSTGHESRLNRSTLTDMAPFGSSNYSKEELVAEMTAAMLCGVTGITQETIENSAAYLRGWLKKLKRDSKLVVQAGAQGQKAADYLRGLQGHAARQGENQARGIVA